MGTHDLFDFVGGHAAIEEISFEGELGAVARELADLFEEAAEHPCRRQQEDDQHDHVEGDGDRDDRLEETDHGADLPEGAERSGSILIFSPRLRRGVAYRGALPIGMVADPLAEPGAIWGSVASVWVFAAESDIFPAAGRQVWKSGKNLRLQGCLFLGRRVPAAN